MFSLQTFVVILVPHLVGGLVLQSFNTGLMPKITGYDVRKEAIVPALLSSHSDLICLQEVWMGHDADSIAEAVQEKYPYSLSAVNEGGQSDFILRVKSILPPCAGTTTLGFLWCVYQKCLHGHDEIDAVECGFKCGLMQQTQDCITCILTTGTDNVIKWCILGVGVYTNNPGLLLLSNRPLRNRQIVQYHPDTVQLTQRAYLHVTVDDVGPVTCTHMSAHYGDVYLEQNLMQKFSGWAQQSLYEAKLLIKETAHDARSVIMGDLNCGPAILDAISGDLEVSYDLLLANGFTDPYISMVGKCTYCADNSLGGYNESWILDHILIKGHHAIESQIIYKEDIPDEDFPLSDHYGIQVTVRD